MDKMCMCVWKGSLTVINPQRIIIKFCFLVFFLTHCFGFAAHNVTVLVQSHRSHGVFIGNNTQL